MKKENPEEIKNFFWISIESPEVLFKKEKKTVQKAAQSVFLLGREGRTPVGHAWKVGDKHFVTCWHVVKYLRRRFVLSADCGDYVFVKNTKPRKYFFARLAMVDKKHDIAILESKEETDFPSLNLSEADLFQGKRLFLLDKLEEPASVFGELMFYSRIETNPPTKGRSLLISIIPRAGESGTPVFDSRGSVAGMITSIYYGTDGEQYSIAVSSRKIEKLLKLLPRI